MKSIRDGLRNATRGKDSEIDESLGNRATSLNDLSLTDPDKMPDRHTGRPTRSGIEV
jgi:hypothetical protein